MIQWYCCIDNSIARMLAYPEAHMEQESHITLQRAAAVHSIALARANAAVCSSSQSSYAAVGKRR